MVDRREMPAEQPQEDPKHIEEMAAKGAALREGTAQPAASPADDQPQDQRPEWLPEKFKTPEDMAKAYAELEKKQGQPAEAKKEEGQTESSETLEIPENADAALKEKGVNLSELQQEYAENNGLSDETYAKLETAGFSRDDVNGYIAGQLALVQQMRTEAFELVGGQENFESMKAWAAANLSTGEKNAFNAALQQDAASREMAIRGLHAKYVAEVGSDSSHIHSNDTGAVSGDIFESRAQLVKAMDTPEYQKDPAYRKKVTEKLARTRSVNPIF